MVQRFWVSPTLNGHKATQDIEGHKRYWPRHKVKSLRSVNAFLFSKTFQCRQFEISFTAYQNSISFCSFQIYSILSTFCSPYSAKSQNQRVFGSNPSKLNNNQINSFSLSLGLTWYSTQSVASKCNYHSSHLANLALIIPLVTSAHARVDVPVIIQLPAVQFAICPRCLDVEKRNFLSCVSLLCLGVCLYVSVLVFFIQLISRFKLSLVWSVFLHLNDNVEGLYIHYRLTVCVCVSVLINLIKVFFLKRLSCRWPEQVRRWCLGTRGKALCRQRE